MLALIVHAWTPARCSRNEFALGPQTLTTVFDEPSAAGRIRQRIVEPRPYYYDVREIRAIRGSI